ncbi:MAG: hypothetical protein ACYS8Z_00715 [Planctomycetota bacterium]
MSSVSNDQKELLFDYAFGLTSDSESAEAEALISSNEEAEDVYGRLQSLLAPLDTVEIEDCPDELAELTISRLIELAGSAHQGLEDLLVQEQDRPVTVKVGFWRNLSEMVAVAAAVMIIAGVLLPIFTKARHLSWRQSCQKQLGSIFGGLRNYVEDHDGRAPAVAAAQDRRWNTQCLYLPLKHGYIEDTSCFVCPGRGGGQVLRFDVSKVSQYNDFPLRVYITYSPRKRCSSSAIKEGLCEGPILSDRNPIFDNDKPVETFKKRLDEAIMRANSRNHQGKGQNVLFSDGSVRFIIKRFVTKDDDIFTLRDGMRKGDELGDREILPTMESDIFMAP